VKEDQQENDEEVKKMVKEVVKYYQVKRVMMKYNPHHQ
jgi:hypothetical protein